MGFDTNATISNQLTIFACPPYPAKIFIRDIVIARLYNFPFSLYQSTVILRTLCHVCLPLWYNGTRRIQSDKGKDVKAKINYLHVNSAVKILLDNRAANIGLISVAVYMSNSVRLSLQFVIPITHAHGRRSNSNKPLLKLMTFHVLQRQYWPFNRILCHIKSWYLIWWQFLSSFFDDE